MKHGMHGNLTEARTPMKHGVKADWIRRFPKLPAARIVAGWRALGFQMSDDYPHVVRSLDRRGYGSGQKRTTYRLDDEERKMIEKMRQEKDQRR